MRLNNTNTFLFIIIFPLITFGQNYIDYQKTINRVDNDICANQLESALLRLDSVHELYSFIYAKHCYKALQISCKLKDSSEIDKWLTKSFVQGIPFWIVQEDSILKTVFAFDNCKETLLEYDSLRKIYLGKVNVPLRITVDSLIEIDQRLTHQVNDGFILLRYTFHLYRWLKNNKRQLEIIKQLTANFGFPGEQLIGLPNHCENPIKFQPNMSLGMLLQETNTYIMLIHCFSNPRPDLNELLIAEVKKGNIPANQFGAINDFMAAYGKNKYGNYSYYNVWHTDPFEENIRSINDNRNKIGLMPFEEQERNQRLFYERRKNRTLYKEIALE